MVTSKWFSLGILLFFAFTPINAQSAQAKKVLAFESRRFEAMIHADTAALRPMLAADLIYIHSNGLKEDKTAHLSAIAARKLVYDKMEREEASVRFYGKTALVNGTLKASGVLKDNAFEVRLLYSALYQKKRGMWQLVNWQSTRVP